MRVTRYNAARTETGNSPARGYKYLSSRDVMISMSLVDVFRKETPKTLACDKRYGLSLVHVHYEARKETDTHTFKTYLVQQEPGASIAAHPAK